MLNNPPIGKPRLIPGQGGNAPCFGSWKFDLLTNRFSGCPAISKIFGFRSGSEIRLSSLFMLLEPKFKYKLIRQCKIALLTGALFEQVLVFNTTGGQQKWLKIKGVPFYRRWGTIEKLIGTIDDVTQQKAEENLSLAIVNHELRSPLTLIKLNVQFVMNMLEDRFLKTEMRLLHTVDLHVNNMVSLMDEYLSPYSNEERPDHCNTSVFDLCDLTKVIVNEMKVLHCKHRFSIQISEPLWVKADKYKILQVFINYINNAVKFSRPSSLITVRAVHLGNWAEIGILDQGRGIPIGEEHNIFQKYYSCESGALRQNNSKGLGLYLVRKIIHEHGGKVSAERIKKGGSAFYFALPLHECKVSGLTQSNYNDKESNQNVNNY